MATSDVDICNIALSRVGQKQLIDALDDDSVEAELCSLHYPLARDAMLQEYWWKFATKTVALALVSGVTRPGWSLAYAIPNDCLATQYIFSGVRRGGPVNVGSAYPPSFPPSQGFARAGAAKVPFEIQVNDALDGRLLLTDMDSAVLFYTAAVANTQLFTPIFADALAWRLAGEFGIGLAVKAALMNQCRNEYRSAILRAAASDFRSIQEDPDLDSEFITVRG